VKSSLSRKFVLDVPIDAVFSFVGTMNRHPPESTRKQVESKASEMVAYDYGCCREDIRLVRQGEKTAVEITITSAKQENASKENLDIHASYLTWFDSLFDLRHGDEPRRICVGCRVRLEFHSIKCRKCGRKYAPLTGPKPGPAEGSAKDPSGRSQEVRRDQ